MSGQKRWTVEQNNRWTNKNHAAIHELWRNASQYRYKVLRNRHMRNNEFTGNWAYAGTHKSKYNKSQILLWQFSGIQIKRFWWDGAGDRGVAILLAANHNHDNKKKKKNQWTEIFCSLSVCQIGQEHRQPLTHFILLWRDCWNNRFHPVPVCSGCLDKHFVLWQIAFYEETALGPARLHKQHVIVLRTSSFVRIADFDVCRCWHRSPCNHLLSSTFCIAKVWINQRQLPYQSLPLARLRH